MSSVFRGGSWLPGPSSGLPAQSGSDRGGLEPTGADGHLEPRLSASSQCSHPLLPTTARSDVNSEPIP